MSSVQVAKVNLEEDAYYLRMGHVTYVDLRACGLVPNKGPKQGPREEVWESAHYIVYKLLQGTPLEDISVAAAAFRFFPAIAKAAAIAIELCIC